MLYPYLHVVDLSSENASNHLPIWYTYISTLTQFDSYYTCAGLGSCNYHTSYITMTLSRVMVFTLPRVSSSSMIVSG